MSQDVLDEQREHLAQLLEAIQRCAWFLHQSEAKIEWAIDPNWLTEHKKDVDLFETLAAINERFAKLQDSLGIRHAPQRPSRGGILRQFSQGPGFLREAGRHRRHQ